MTLRVVRLCLLVAAAAPGLLLLSGTREARAGRVLDPQSTRQTTLPNGLRVVIKEAPSINLVALNVWVRAGSADETPATNGISHYLEHLVFKGTKRRGPGDFDSEIEGLGGLANAVTMEDATQYYVVVAKPYADQALAALGDVMANATFPEEEFRREQQIIRDEIKRAADDPERVLSDFLNRLSFKQHPYCLPPAGTEESVRRITRDQIVEFYNKHYVAANMSLVVVGAVKAEEILPKIQAAFSELRPGAAPERTRTPEPVPTEVSYGAPPRPAVKRGYVMLGFRAPGMDTKEDVCAMDVLLYILGEQRGQAGRLNRELRQKRNLVSAIWGDYVTLRDPGIVTFWAETEPDKVDAARDAILEQIGQVRETLVPEDEIQRAKMLLLGVYTLDNETYDGQASTLGFYEAKDTYEFALHYEELIQKVTAADVQRVARKYLAEKSYSLATLRPPQATPAGVAAAPAPAVTPGEPQ